MVSLRVLISITIDHNCADPTQGHVFHNDCLDELMIKDRPSPPKCSICKATYDPIEGLQQIVLMTSDGEDDAKIRKAVAE